MRETPSTYYKLPLFDGLEALNATDYNASFPYHFHPTFNISLVYEGVFKAKLTDKSVSAPPGSILITNPQEIHANPCEKKDRISFFTFYLTPDLLKDPDRNKSLIFTDKVIYDKRIFDQLHRLSLRIRDGHIDDRFEQEFRKALGKLASSYGVAGEDEGTAQKTSTLFSEFLAEQTNEKFSLEEAAKRFGIDKYKFLRLFKHQTGLTPNHYFIFKRIEQSKSLLAEGKDLLSIAIELGFYDAAHFCHHFKKFTGISPLAFGLAT